MKKKYVILGMVLGAVFFCAMVAVAVSQSKPADKDLQFLHIIMRHGERTPADTYPTDPYLNFDFFPIGWGQLTNRGKNDLYNIGKYYRERYGKYLGDQYNTKEFFTQSTGVDRTKASMQLVNAGLWPPVGPQKWGPLDWQPIPITSEFLEEDTLLLVRRPCPQYHLELERVMNTPEIQDKLRQLQPMFQEVSQHTGKEIKTFEDIQDVFSTLKAEEGFNLTLPDWTKNYYPDRMYESTVFSYILNAYNDKLNRLKGGVLLKKLIADWQQKVDGTIKPKERKAILYGGHDSTIVNLMQTLGVWDPQLPGYAISILLELSRDPIRNVYGVEVFLRNSTTADPFLLTIPGCDTFCPLDRLVELTRPVIPDNWEEECKTDIEGYTVPPLGGP